MRSWREGPRAALVVASLLLVAIFCVVQTGPTAVWRHSGIGAGRASLPPADEVNATKLWCNAQRRNLQWEADGIESSIGITAPDGLSFVVNGKNDGNAIGDAGTQIGVAILGAMLQDAPKSGLVIGLGTGESAGWLASMPGVERVDVVELEPAIDEMARRSSTLNRDVLHHPKVRRIYNDGREHVLTTDQQYDVILSEPSNPYRAGVASLYTQEFYRAVRDRLTPHGVFVQWVQAYEVDGFTVSTVLATARSVFKHVEIWQTIPGDLQVVCSEQPTEYSVTRLRGRIEEPVMKEALRVSWRVTDLEGFLARFLGSAEFVDQQVQAEVLVPNTDDRNFLEYGFAKTVGLSTGFSNAALREAAVAADKHRPPLADGAVDWDLVDKRRLQFNWLFGGELTVAPTAKGELRTLADGYSSFVGGNYRAALDKWAELPPAPLSDVDRLVQGRAHAELGEAQCLDLIAPIASQYPAETAAIRAVYYWKRKDQAQAAAAVGGVCESLAENPLTIAAFVESALNLAMEIGNQDSGEGRRYFELLAKPLAGNRFEYQRTLIRLQLAENLGAAEMLAALAAVEPDPPWIGDVLRLRAEAYMAAKHPLADEAQRDWESYQRQAN